VKINFPLSQNICYSWLSLHPAAPQEDAMYARMIQLTAKSGQGKELTKVMKERTLPILKQQPGFIDALALNSDTEPNQFVGITVWKSKEDADKYLGG
jgi:heme-degrading monooxygenase HmoA